MRIPSSMLKISWVILSTWSLSAIRKGGNFVKETLEPRGIHGDEDTTLVDAVSCPAEALNFG